MADKSKFEEPGKKTYSVRDMLTQHRIQISIQYLVGIQKHLLETFGDGPYMRIEAVFDTAIASLLAHELDVDIQKVGQRGGKESV